MIGTDILQSRWHFQSQFGLSKVLSLRSPLELTIAFSRPNSFVDKNGFQANVTCLDLSDLKMSKLDGIEQLPNLCFLNIAQNKISSLKKLRGLQNLTFLDASSNVISKIEELPAMLSELNLSRNHISCLNFCAELQLLAKLNVSYNRLKNLKGLESCKLLEYLLIGENQIRDRNEVDIFSNFSKITVVDFSGCAISETDSFRKRLLLLCPTLLSINREKVPMEEKDLVQKKSGKVLTWDFLEKNVTDLKTGTCIELVKQDFRMIALDRTAIANLSHITLVDLSRNALEHVYELVDLPNLLTLNLSHNCIVSLASTPMIAGINTQTQILPKLECLNLSYNNLTNQTLLRVGIAHLTRLKRLILIGNQITKFDASGLDLPQLQELDISKNEIKSIKKKPMNYLKKLSLAENKLRIGTCAAIKPISTMVELKELLCAGNPVVERRVYSDFITSQTNNLQLLDGEPITSNRVPLSVQKRKSSVVQVHQKGSSPSRQPVVAYSRRSFDNGISLFPQEQYNPWSRMPLKSSSRMSPYGEEGASPEQTFFSINSGDTNSLSLASSTSSLRNLEKKLSVPNISSRRSPSPISIEKSIYSKKSTNPNDGFYIAGISLLKQSKS